MDLMSYIKWCDVLKSGYDVIERRSDVTQKVGVMSFKSGCDISGEVVMKRYSGCNVSYRGVM